MALSTQQSLRLNYDQRLSLSLLQPREEEVAQLKVNLRFAQAKPTGSHHERSRTHSRKAHHKAYLSIMYSTALNNMCQNEPEAVTFWFLDFWFMCAMSRTMWVKMLFRRPLSCSAMLRTLKGTESSNAGLRKRGLGLEELEVHRQCLAAREPLVWN